MKQLAGIIFVLSLAVKLYAGIATTPEMLATQFVTAVNERSTEKQKAIVHPRCFANLSKEKDQWFIIIPMLNAENLNRYEEKNKSQPIAPPRKK